MPSSQHKHRKAGEAEIFERVYEVAIAPPLLLDMTSLGSFQL
jgi:hypothetical protein